jgi:hypothetical protein
MDRPLPAATILSLFRATEFIMVLLATNNAVTHNIPGEIFAMRRKDIQAVEYVLRILNLQMAL